VFAHIRTQLTRAAHPLPAQHLTEGRACSSIAAFHPNPRPAPIAAHILSLMPIFRSLFLVSLALLLSVSAVAAAKPMPPNIVFIFADDWGWGDLASHSHPWLKTPHLDRLAREGTDFHQFNVLNPVCSPSRAAAMTGMFPSRFGIHQHFAAPAQNLARTMPDWLDARAPTIARFLQQAGYRTAHFGKWHLTNRNTHGAPAPTAYGFDEFAVFNGGAETASADLHATPENAARFIAANKDRPFYLNVWLHESHLPHVPTKASLEKWQHLDDQKRVYAAVITDGDNAVGRVLDALEAAGVAHNTLVIFSSDNGPETTAAKTQQSSRDDDAGVAGYGGYYRVGSSGGLRGETPEEAFTVRCDASTNPPEEVALGRVWLEVGVAIAAPAEFIVFRLGSRTALGTPVALCTAAHRSPCGHVGGAAAAVVSRRGAPARGWPALCHCARAGGAGAGQPRGLGAGRVRGRRQPGPGVC
jgi:hypothetical protein